MNRENRIRIGKETRLIVAMAGVQFYPVNRLPGMNSILGFYHVLPFGEIWSDYKGDVLNTSATVSAGYLQVRLQQSGGDARTLYIHRLIGLLKYQRTLAIGEQSRHLDGDNRNNGIENIAYGTTKANANDRILHGTSGIKYTEEQVRMVRAFAPLVGDTTKKRRHGISKAKIMKRAGVNSGAIGPIAERKRRQDVPEFPDGAEGIVINFDSGKESAWTVDDYPDAIRADMVEILQSIRKEQPELWKLMNECRNSA